MHKWTVRAARVALVATAITVAGAGAASADETSGDYGNSVDLLSPLLGARFAHLPTGYGKAGNWDAANWGVGSWGAIVTDARYWDNSDSADGPQLDVCGNAFSSGTGVGTATCTGEATLGTDSVPRAPLFAPSRFVPPAETPAPAPIAAPAAPAEAKAAAPFAPAAVKAPGTTVEASGMPVGAPNAAIGAPGSPVESATAPAAAPATAPDMAPAEAPATAPDIAPDTAPAGAAAQAPYAPIEAPATAPVDVPEAPPAEQPMTPPVDAPMAPPAEAPVTAPAAPPVEATETVPAADMSSGQYGVNSGDQIHAPMHMPIRFCGNAGAFGGGSATASCQGTASSRRLSGQHAFGAAGLLG